MAASLILDVFKEYDGILGTLLGLFFSTLITLCLRNSGQVKMILKECDFRYYKANNGRKALVNFLNEADYAEILFEIDIYNSAENFKTINDIVYHLIDEDDAVIHTGKLNDAETSRQSYGAYQYNYDLFTYLNCKPKELTKKDLVISYTPSNILLLQVSKKIIIEANREGELFPFKRGIRMAVTIQPQSSDSDY